MEFYIEILRKLELLKFNINFSNLNIKEKIEEYKDICKFYFLN